MSFRKRLTRPGYEQLCNEYTELLKVTRPKVVRGIATAAAEGDRSENAEYIYGKKRLREIDRRLKYLGGLLKDVEIVDSEKLRGAKAQFGSTVEITLDSGEKRRYTLVGEGESNPAEGRININAPVGQAIQHKELGDIIEIPRDGAIIDAEITWISHA